VPPQASMPERRLVPLERIQRAILVVRGHKVILDADLAALYDVPTKRLNEQVKRNHDRFPPDFTFVLTREEHAALRSHSATSKPAGRGDHRKYPPACSLSTARSWPRASSTVPACGRSSGCESGWPARRRRLSRRPRRPKHDPALHGEKRRVLRELLVVSHAIPSRISRGSSRAWGGRFSECWPWSATRG